MTLPLSGQLSMNDIRTELGIPSQAPFSLDTAENGGYVAINQCSPYKPSAGNPAAISEWYGYNHTATCYNIGSSFAYDASTCCTGYGGPSYSIYSCCSSLAVNCYVYSNSGCTTPLGDGYWSDSTTCYYVSGGQVKTISSCTTTTTTTAAPTYSFTIYYNFYVNPSSETLANWGLYYSINGGGDTLITDLSTGNTCTTAFTVSGITSGSTVYIGVKNSGKAGYPVNFDLSLISCPNTLSLTYCGTNNTSPASPYSYSISSNRTFYITIAVNKTGYFITC